MIKSRAFVAGIIFLAVACRSVSVEKPGVEGVRSHMTGIDFEGVNLVFDVDVKNHFSFPLHSPLFKYAIDVAGIELTSGSRITGIELAPESLSRLSLPLRISYIDVWRVFRNLRVAKEVDYRLQGGFVFEKQKYVDQKIELPISYSGKFSILNNPTVAIMRLGKPQVSAGHAQLEIAAEVKNPNTFPLGIEDLRYELRIGGAPIGHFGATMLGSIDAQTSGRFNLVADISMSDTVLQLLTRQNTMPAQIVPYGTIRTPYGIVPLIGVIR